MCIDYFDLYLDIFQDNTALLSSAKIKCTTLLTKKYTVIHTLHKRGYSIRAILKIVGLDRRTVSKHLKEKELKPYSKIRYKSKPSYQTQVDWIIIRSAKNQHGFNNDFLDFAKDNLIPKLCKVYKAKTKSKVERFNLYLKRNFHIPLKAALKGSKILRV